MISNSRKSLCAVKIVQVKVKLSSCLTERHAVNTYLVLN